MYTVNSIVFALVITMPFAIRAQEEHLLVYYSFDDISGDTVTDLSGTGNDGTLLNDPRTVGGKFGDANAWHQLFIGMNGDYTTLFFSQNGQLRFRGFSGPDYITFCETADSVVKVDEWTHIALVNDEKKYRLCVNGVLLKESDYQESRGGDDAFYLGGNPDRAAEYYSGVVDDFAIFGEPLDQAAIKSIMENGISASVRPAGKLATQ